MGLREARELIRNRKLDEVSLRQNGGYPINPINTTRGTAVMSNELQGFADEARKEWEAEQDFKNRPAGNDSGNLGVGWGEPAGSEIEELVKGTSTQKKTPAQKPTSTSLPTSGYENVGQFAQDWFESVGRGAQADKARLVAQKAVQHGLDPYIALALGAQEGGWLRYYPETSPYNYMGWGVTDSGDMGMAGESLEGWLDTFLPDIAKQYGVRDKLVDWGGSPSGYGAGSPYDYRYNYNDSWIDALSSLMGQADAFRQQNYPNLAPPAIDYRYRR
jgi:hypothetical protein